MPSVAGGSDKAVYVAITANSLVMIAKFGAFAMTGSAGMLSEGIHSLADVGNQSLLALGIRKSRAEATKEHPYGFRRERFVWALISAVGIFFLGCGVTLYHGVSSLLHPHAYEGSITVLVVVLIFSFVIEGWSLLVAIKATSAERAGRSMLQFFRESNDPMGATVLLEDGAAVLGVAIASVGIGLSLWTGNPAFDAIGSILIGIMLGAIAVALVNRNRQLLLGEAANPEVVERLESLLAARPEVQGVSDVKAVVVGAQAIRFKAEVDFDGRVLTEMKLQDMDLAETLARLDSPESLRGFLLDFGDTMVEAVGEAVDRIEEQAATAVPELAHVDLEAD
jgi:zinc transporter 9